MEIEIKKVVNDSDLRKFIQFPFSIYKNNPYWIPPLLQDEKKTLKKNKNPAFKYCEAEYWLAYNKGKIVGRIAGIINPRYIKKWGKNVARFGWFDFIDNIRVSQKLLTTVENYAKEHNLIGVHGPLGFTDLDPEGMLIEGFEELGTLPMIYNFPYYPKHMEQLGYEKDVDWLEFQIFTPPKIPEKVLRIQDLVLKRSGLHLLPAKQGKDIFPYAKGIFQVINEAYSHLYGTVELTEEQIDAYTKQYFPFIQPDYTKIILDEHNNVVAFGIAMPSLSHAIQKAKGRLFPIGFLHILKAIRKPKTIDLYLVAVKPKYQKKGVNSILITEITKACINNGIEYAESSGELEDNQDVQRMWKHFDKRQHKRRRCFIKYF